MKFRIFVPTVGWAIRQTFGAQGYAWRQREVIGSIMDEDKPQDVALWKRVKQEFPTAQQFPAVKNER